MGPRQADVIRAALGAAGLTPSALDLVEANAVGSALGDAVEAGALCAVAKGCDGLPVGASKGLFGNLESASAMAATLRALLSLRAATCPPNPYPRTLNQSVAGAMHAPTALGIVRPSAVPLIAADASARRAGVSSFGVAGTNAHLLWEERRGGGGGVDDALARGCFAPSAVRFERRSLGLCPLVELPRRSEPAR